MTRESLARENAAARPDLPALESVETLDRSRTSALLVMMCMFSFVPFMCVWGFVKYRQFLDTTAYSAAVVLFACIGWVVFRVLSGYTRSRTGTDGITLRGPVRRRTIRWTDIKLARTARSKTGYTVLVLETVNGPVKMVPSNLGGIASGDVLIASVWQHLHRLGRADGIEFSEPMQSLWSAIPDDVPQEMEWGKPASRWARVGWILLALAYAAFVGFLWCDAVHKAAMLIMCSSMTLGCALLAKTLLLPTLHRTACQVRVSPNGLEAADALGAWRTMPWNTVRAAWWSQNSLHIRSGDREVWVPYTLGSRESEQLVLAIIRRLRERTTCAVPFPVVISASKDYLKQPAFSSEKQRVLQQAFLNTLDEPVRKRIRRIYALEMLTILVAMLATMVAGLANAPGMFSRLIFGRGDTLYFAPSSSLPIAVPLVIGVTALAGAAIEWLGCRLAGPYGDVWQEFCKIGNSGRFGRVLAWACVIIGAAALLSLPILVCSYARITNHGMAISRPGQFSERFYPWSSIRGVAERRKTTSHNGHTDSSSTYTVRFSDGSDWRYDEDMLIAAQRPQLRDAIGFVARRSGRELRVRVAD